MKLSLRHRIAKELWSHIPDNDSFVVESDMIIKVPVVDVLRYLLVTTPTRASQYEFDFYVEAMPLFYPGDSRYSIIAKKLNDCLAEYEVAKAIATMPKGLAFLNEVASSKDVFAIMKNPTRDKLRGLLDESVREFLLATSLGMSGDWDEAERKLREFIGKYQPIIPALEERLNHVQNLITALESGPKDAQAILDSWILNRCTKLGIKQYLAAEVQERISSYSVP